MTLDEYRGWLGKREAQVAEIEGFRVAWSAGVSRWTKHGHDHLYIPGRKGGCIDLADVARFSEPVWNDPYGTDSKAIMGSGGRLGAVHQYRHEFVSVIRLTDEARQAFA